MVLSSSSLSPWHFSSFKISRILGTFFQDITPRDHKTGHFAAAQERCLDVNTVSIIHQRRLLAIHLHLQEYSIQHSAHNLCRLPSWPHTNHGQCGTPSRLQDTFADKCQETSMYIVFTIFGEFGYVEMQPPLILASSLHLDCRQHHSSRHRNTTWRGMQFACPHIYQMLTSTYTDIYVPHADVDI